MPSYENEIGYEGGKTEILDLNGALDDEKRDITVNILKEKVEHIEKILREREQTMSQEQGYARKRLQDHRAGYIHAVLLATITGLFGLLFATLIK